MSKKSERKERGQKEQSPKQTLTATKILIPNTKNLI